MAKDNLPKAGFKLDEEIAWEIFGQPRPPEDHHSPDHIDAVTFGVWFCIPDFFEDDKCCWDVLPFSTKIEYAWKVIEEMEKRDLEPFLEKNPVNNRNLWVAGFKPAGQPYVRLVAAASEPAHAICLAALEATKRV